MGIADRSMGPSRSPISLKASMYPVSLQCRVVPASQCMAHGGAREAEQAYACCACHTAREYRLCCKHRSPCEVECLGGSLGLLLLLGLCLDHIATPQAVTPVQQAADGP